METAANSAVKITTPKRALLTEIDYMNRQVYGLDNAVQLPGFIRSEVVLGVQNEISFAIGTNEQANGQTIVATENRLNINDAFFITHYKVGFLTFPTATPADRLRARIHQFANTQVFGLNTPSVQGAFNGKLSLRVDDKVFIDSMDMLRFYAASEAQQGLAVSTAASNNAYFADAWDNVEGWANETDPLVRLNGPGKNIFRVQLPDTVSFNLVAGQQVVAVLYLRGWLSQNGGGFRSVR
jgi:hypothetical protein